MRVRGLDLSLSATGICAMEPGQTPRCAIVGSKPDTGTIADRSARLRGMVTRIWPYLSDAELVVVEQPSYGSTGGKAHDRSGLWWMVVGRLTGAGIPVVEVAPNTLKVYALGKGRGTKEEVMAAVIRRYLDVEVRDDNAADALVLACMGSRAAGTPYDPSLPATHVRAMKAVTWPILEGVQA